MAIENTSTNTTPTAGPADKSQGDKITADTYRTMLTVLEELISHDHIFYDDYTTVCECQCQCACNRGTV